jgi:hypothetical protein
VAPACPHDCLVKGCILNLTNKLHMALTCAFFCLCCVRPEGILWHLLTTPVKITRDQVGAALRTALSAVTTVALTASETISNVIRQCTTCFMLS